MNVSETQFMTSDNHTIYEVPPPRINLAGNIEVGDHVWIGLQSFVMKGVKIWSGSIVGLQSVVTCDIPENSMAAGAPARVIREGVSWDHDLWSAGADAAQRH